MNTKQIILNSVEQLLQKKSIDRITVDMILKDSSVSRATFYKYFKDKYDAFNWVYQHSVDTIISRFDSNNWESLLAEIYEFIGSNSSYFVKIADDANAPFWDFLIEYSYVFYERAYLTANNKQSLTYIESMKLNHTCAGAVYMVRKWLMSGMKINVDEMAEMTFEMLPQEFKSIL